MIRSCISGLSKYSDSCRNGPYPWRDSRGGSNTYPLYVEGAHAESFLTMESENPEDSGAVFAALHAACISRSVQLGVAESCTGGLVSSLITEHPGSSAYFYGGWVVYSNHAKYDWLQVSPHDLEQDGAVSAIIIQDLLRGIFGNSPSTYGIAISGIAGPDGGSLEKPVGTVWVGVAGKQGTVLLREFRFAGDRRMIRNSAAQVAGLMLLELFWLIENKIDTSWKL